MEIERKFWIPKSDTIFEYKKISVIKQYYLNKPTDFYEIRLREYVFENRFYIDFKGKGDMIREEFGTKLTKEEYFQILKGAEQVTHILKHRYYIEPGVFYDEFQGKLKGLNILEKEGNEDEVKNYKLTQFKGIEVTCDDKFKNRNLSGKIYENIKNDLYEYYISYK